MNKFNIHRGWTKNHTKITFGYALFVSFLILLIYNTQAVHPIWFPITISIIGWYFYTLHYCTRNWANLSEKKFERKLFWYSLLYRVGTSILLITIAQLTWGRPDYVGAVDAIQNFEAAKITADSFRGLDFKGGLLYSLSTARIDDIGPVLLIGAILSVFGKHYFIGSLVYCVISSFGVVLLYRMAKMIWGNAVGRTSGLMYMHFPLSLFFSVIFLKEAIVVFLLLLIIYLTTKSILGHKLKIHHYITLIVALVSLFFFRTAVGALLAILVPSSFLIYKYRGSLLKTSFIGVSIAVIFGFLIYLIGEYEFFLNRIYSADRVGEQRTAGLGIGGVEVFGFSLIDFALTPVYLMVSLIAPFAGMVDVGTTYDTGHDANYYRMPGNLIWNALAYFSIIGLYYTIKEKLFESFMLWAFTGGYMYILITTVLFTRDRFAYVGMPVMLAFAAVGVYKSKNNTYWILYLSAIIIMTIIWNYLRLSLRGI